MWRGGRGRRMWLESSDRKCIFPSRKPKPRTGQVAEHSDCQADQISCMVAESSDTKQTLRLTMLPLLLPWLPSGFCENKHRRKQECLRKQWLQHFTVRLVKHKWPRLD